MTPRRIFFWFHLIVGAAAGLFILNMAVTGAIIAYEPQITEFTERHARFVEVPSPQPQRLGLNELAEKAGAERPGKQPAGITVKADPAASVIINFGGEDTSFVNPYTGDILGGLSKTHNVMHKIVEWHRWLGKKEIGKPITGAACLSFLILLLSGLYLWLRGKTFFFNSRLTGRSRDFNWHNVIGLWCSVLILAATTTGLVMSYEWANNLLYRATGNEPPPARRPEGAEKKAGAPRVEGQERKERGVRERNEIPRAGGLKDRDMRGEGDKPKAEVPAINFDVAFAQTTAKVPGWTSIMMRMPRKAGDPVTIFIEEPSLIHGAPRSQLVLDAATGVEKKWEPASSLNMGRRLRFLTKPIHTGEIFGWFGQTLMFIASLGAVMLVWTGFALAWRRLQSWREDRRAEKRSEPVA